MSVPRWAWPPALLLALAMLTGCGATVTSQTTAVIGDPSRVAILRGDDVVLPQGSSEASAPLGETEIEPTAGGRSKVAVTALRDDTGGVWFAWDTRLPLVNGEKQAMLPSVDGRRPTLSMPDGAIPMGIELRMDLCVSLRASGTSGYRAVVRPRACGPGDLGGQALTLETPWDNVVVTHRTQVVPRTRQALGLAGGVLVGVPLVVLAYGGPGGGLPELEVLGVSVAAGGIVLATALVFPGPRSCTETLGPGVVPHCPHPGSSEGRSTARARLPRRG